MTSKGWKLAFLLVTTAAPAAAQATPDVHAAEAFVRRFYTWYLPLFKHSPDAEDTALSRHPAWFAPALRAALRADERESGRTGDIDGLDGDPFLNAQDWCQGIVIGSGAVRDSIVAVPVYDVCDGHRADTAHVIADLKPAGASWVFVDFESPGQKNLLALLAELKTTRDSTAAANRPPKSKFVRVNGVRLNYLDWGGSGTGIVFIHGLGDSPHAFDDIAPAFRAGYRVVSYARRAHGRSEVKGPYDPATLTEDLEQLLDSLGIRRAVLVGWSLGSDELSGMAEHHPDRVAGLVYLECYNYGDPGFGPLLQHYPLNVSPSRADLASQAAFRRYWKRVSTPNATLTPAMDAEIADLTLRRPNGTVAVITNDSLSTLFFTAAQTYRQPYAQFHMPVLGIWAHWNRRGLIADAAPDSLRRKVDAYLRDYGWPFQDSTIARMRAAMPQARLIVLDSGAHAIFPFQNHDTIISEMRGFLARVR